MKKILLIVRSFSKVGPQPLRFQMIAGFLKSKYEIHILEIHHQKEVTIFENGIWLHKIKYSFPGIFLNPDFNKKNDIKEQNVLKIYRFKSRVKKIIRNFFFPDTLIFEKNNLTEKVNDLIEVQGFYAVVASGFPFTMLILSKTIKKKFPDVKFIYDIGDPFYKNSQNGYLKDKLAKLFERKYLKYVDKLVVTDKMILRHYLYYFGDVLRKDQVEVVQMGVSSEFLESFDSSLKIGKSCGPSGVLRLVYAGQLYTKLREPFELYKAVNKLSEQGGIQSIKLDMFGSFSDLFKTSTKQNPCIYFKGIVSNKEIIEAYFNCDIIVFLDNAYGMQTPGKIFEVSVIGRPVLFISDAKNSSALEIVKELKHVYPCKNECDSIVDAIKSVNCKIDFSIIQKIRKDFSWENRAVQYANLINQ